MTAKIRSSWIMLLLLAGLAGAPSAGRADNYLPYLEHSRYGNSDMVQDIIDIQRVEDGLIGVVEGRRIYRIDLELREHIVWRQAVGAVGAVLTGGRFLAISEKSHGWRELSLRLDESDKPEQITPLISDYLALLVTGKRIVGFDSERGRWVQQAIPIHDRVVSPHINRYVAAVVTNNRIYAWSRGRIDFTEEYLREVETIQSVDTRPHTITVRTDRRVLVFRSGGGWRQFDGD